MKRVIDRRVVPVVVIENAELAVPLAEAIAAGGLDLIEITFRTAAAADAIKRIRQALPSMLVGAGTLLQPDQVARAVDAGAGFGVAPGLNPKIVAKAQALKLPFCPGVMTPSDVEAGLELGCTMLKFFPSEAAGGVKMLKAIGAPYAHTGVKFIPTGGINMTNVAEYFALPLVGAIGGTWLAEAKLINEKQWAEITRRTREVVALATQTPAKK